MIPDENPFDPALDRAVSEIRDEPIDPLAVAEAAARVWAKVSVAGAGHPFEHIRGCADFQALLPDFRAGRLEPARALLVADHLRECVACRKSGAARTGQPVAIREGRATPVRWAIAAVVVLATGASVWLVANLYSPHWGRALVRTVDGALYEVSPRGMVALAAGQEIPDGVEILAAKDSSATVELRDGSLVELRERSAFSTSAAGKDVTLHLERGSVIVQAAKRRVGHLYLATADCRVAVTGTVFGVDAGTKGSRVSVVEGEVHVSQSGADKVLHPGDQSVTGESLDPVPVTDGVSWSRNRTLAVRVPTRGNGIAQSQLPALRYSSRLLDHLPASTVLFASLPNRPEYLAQGQALFQRRLSDNPETRTWWSARGQEIGGMIDKLAEAGPYLGDEIVMVAVSGAAGGMVGPVFVAETKGAGLADFLKREKIAAAVAERPPLVAFGPDASAVETVSRALDSGGFQATPFHAQIAKIYQQGAGWMLCADLKALRASHAHPGAASYRIVEGKQVNGRMEARASAVFDGPRTGMAAWLAAPAPMGALDYLSPETSLLGAFAVKSPAAIVDEVAGLRPASGQDQSPAERFQAEAGFDVRNDVAATLGGEFAVALDGPMFPVPSWRLVVEVYDTPRLASTLLKFVAAYNRKARQPLRASQEIVDGRTFYMIAGAGGNPLTEVHYTFSEGYLIAGPSRAAVSRALQVKASGIGVARSSAFTALLPRDRYPDCSALIYQRLGATLAPLVGLLGALGQKGPGGSGAVPNLANLPPALIAVYGETDRVTIASGGSSLGISLTEIMNGHLLGMAGSLTSLPIFQGTRRPEGAYR